jgi:hypothetical protein
VWVGAGLTVAGAGLVAWWGLDTLAERDAFLASPSQEELDRGRDKQLRTNVALAATGAVAALTVLAAVTIVDWRGNARVAAGPGSVRIDGRF